ncbi:MAG: exodeoxyribonuclease VII large subunit [SAR324 cluster bacterium]|uniref:Exodeoxyribonuclease 7 large subunit n=1 Tax=SAR324 cluster bacterium TaxID=2024889 RepID=A0A2A4T849_9DELT|nr:MAG: exodeoxyribonuclease VII large subunit [SAR324 cluster bacterium]
MSPMNVKPLTVTQLTLQIKQQLETRFDNVCLKGEISNLALPRSGHAYFNIKDQRSQLAGVMFRSALQQNRFQLENGQEVLLFGRITVYEPRGAYQLIVNRVEPIGVGALQLAFEQLKAKLAREGLFEDLHKKRLPFLPRGIGIVTSPTGAAIQDILQILSRRFPSIPVLINPVAVQGQQAAAEIAQAIQQFQMFADEIDVLIVGRGGGSIEDLWAFNEEVVARAIFQSSIPVVTAVGHETDFTIADFVSDLRAPTPSAAAELVVPLRSELLGQVENYQLKLVQRIQKKLGWEKERLEFYGKRLRSPSWVIQGQMQKVDELTDKLIQIIQRKLIQLRSLWERLEQALLYQSPERKIELDRKRLLDGKRNLERLIKHIVEQKKLHLAEVSHVLDSVSPLAVLKRGYATVTDKEHELIYSINQVRKGAVLAIQVSDGVIKSHVEEIIKKP